MNYFYLQIEILFRFLAELEIILKENFLDIGQVAAGRLGV